jgi:hypothetical protein
MMVGTDIRAMTPVMKQCLLNDELLAINQDYLAPPGDEATSCGDAAWVRNMSDGTVAVAVVNMGDEDKTVAVCFADVGWGAAAANVRDVWTDASLANVNGTYARKVGPHDTLLVVLSAAAPTPVPTPAPPTPPTPPTPPPPTPQPTPPTPAPAHCFVSLSKQLSKRGCDPAPAHRQCDDYCASSGACDWTAQFSCPWAPAAGTSGRAADDGSVGYECCCVNRAAAAQPCGYTAPPTPAPTPPASSRRRRADKPGTYGCTDGTTTMYVTGGCQGVFSCDGVDNVECDSDGEGRTTCNCTAALQRQRTPLDAAAAYSTNFSVIDPALWSYDTSCFDCSAKNPDECTKNLRSAVRAGSIADGAGLMITTSHVAYNATGACTPTPAGGTSGYLGFKRALTFGTIRVKARYFPGSSGTVKTAKAFIGLEDSNSGAITITMHGAGATASGAPKDANWTRYMQSSCYQHGDAHNKEFTELDASVNAAESFNWYEVTWTASSVTIKVNDKVVKTYSGAENVPQKPLYAKLHSRSIGYSDMPDAATFSSYVAEFHFEPLATAA